MEFKEKEEFLEKLNNEQLKHDLKKVLDVLPEGVMIYKRHGERHIKLWNDELLRLFKFKPLEKANVRTNTINRVDSQFMDGNSPSQKGADNL